MITRKNLPALFFLFLVTAGSASASIAVAHSRTPIEKNGPLTGEQKARIEALKNRVMQIQAMDRSKLTTADRKELRQELKNIKKEARKISTKGFLIVFGIIVIVILVLLLAF